MIKQVLISSDLISYLEKRGLVNQYKKAKKYILAGNCKQVSLKIREPKKAKIFYFRINRQYRALTKLEGDILKIFEIDNHQ